jgi:septal ring factor EnvC (AmiA/AmiB activator)
MRVALILLAMMAMAGPVRADVLPPAVRDLQAKVAAAEGKLAQLKTELDATQARYVTLDKELRALVELMLRAQGYPPGFWTARGVLTNQPGAVGAMSAVLRQGQAELTATQARASQLAEVYGQMNTQMAQVREVQSAYADARGRLLRQEKDVLRQAGVKAEALAAALQNQAEGKPLGLTADEMAPISPVEIPAPALAPVVEKKVEPVAEKPVVVAEAAPKAAPGWPVAGRVVRPFHTGDGAMSEGVVLKAKAGAAVKAPVSGEVLYAGPFRQFGGLVIVKAENGDNILLGGLGVLHVNRGNPVVSGGVLGEVGDDGTVYWEVRRNGREIDPMRLVKAKS